MSDAQKRTNYFDLKRDETMALNEYIKSPISDRDLKSNPPVKEIDIPKKKSGSVSVKKDKPSIMDLPTNTETKKKNKSKNNKMPKTVAAAVPIGAALLGMGISLHIDSVKDRIEKEKRKKLQKNRFKNTNKIKGVSSSKIIKLP